MRTVKKIGIAVILLALGAGLGALLAGPADVVQGQDLAQRFIVAYPPSPCKVAVQSRIVVAEDGSATGKLTATPPSPCTSLDLDIVSVPENTARCEQKAGRRRVKVKCEFSAEHQHTTFFFNSSARD